MAIDTSPYERQRRGVNDDFAAKSAAATYGRFTSQQRFNRNRDANKRDFGRSVPKFTANYGRRRLTGPMTQSGVYKRALTDYSNDYARSQAELGQDYAGEQSQYDLQLAQYQAERERALADIEMEKARQIALAASNLQALRPYF